MCLSALTQRPPRPVLILAINFLPTFPEVTRKIHNLSFNNHCPSLAIPEASSSDCCLTLDPELEWKQGYLCQRENMINVLRHVLEINGPTLEFSFCDQAVWFVASYLSFLSNSFCIYKLGIIMPTPESFQEFK